MPEVMTDWKTQAQLDYAQRESLKKAKADRDYNERMLKEQIAFAKDLSALLGVTVEARDVGVEKCSGEIIGGITIEGVDFTRAWIPDEYFGSFDGIAVAHLCGQCKERVRSHLVKNLADLGRELSASEPTNKHVCKNDWVPDQPEPQTTETRLVQALRDLIYESQERGL